MTTKKKGLTCTKCGETKPKKDFGPGDKKNEKSSQCRQCKKEYQRAYTAARRAEAQRDPEIAKTAKMKARAGRVAWYGITEEDYDQMLALQGGVCAGCGRPPKPGRRLDIDHKHQSGDKKRMPFERASHVRGLLCHLCNRVLGILRDNPQTFKNLANYLESPPALVVVAPKIKRLRERVEQYLEQYEQRKNEREEKETK